MKILYMLPVIFIFFSCTGKVSSNRESSIIEDEIQKIKFQSIINSANIDGAILIYDLQEDKLYSNDFEWSRKGKLPASTFKIPNSIIAIETGVVKK